MHSGLSHLSGEEINDPSRLHRSAVIAEVSLRHEAPMQTADHPLLQASHVQLDVPVDTVSPRGNSLLVLDECIHGLLAHFTDAVYGLLKAEPIMYHDDADNVMRVAASLFYIVRENILKGSFFSTWFVGSGEVALTLDHDM